MKYNICFECDEKFAEICCVAMLSCIHATSDNIDFYIINSGISINTKQMLEEFIISCNAHIIWIEKINLTEKLGKKLDTSSWPVDVLQRLFIADMVPENIERILYLDSDILVRSNFESLYNIFLDENEIVAGVSDCISTITRANIGLMSDDAYINAGVLLIDLKKWRDHNISDQIISFCSRYSRNLQYNDQDIINGVLKGHLRIVSPVFNSMVQIFTYSRNELMYYHNAKYYYDEEKLDYARNKTVIVHFNSDIKTIRPWYQNGSHPFRDEWLEVRKHTPWGTCQLWQDDRTLKNKIKYLVVSCLPNVVFLIIGRKINRMHSLRYSKYA